MRHNRNLQCSFQLPQPYFWIVGLGFISTSGRSSPSVGRRAGVREATPPAEGKKSHIGSERVPFWIDRQKNEMHLPCVVGALEALQGQIPLAEPSVHQCHRVGRNTPLARTN